MFNDDEKPSPFRYIRSFIFLAKSLIYYHLSFKKRFVSIESRPHVWGIWNVVVYGPNISIGKNVVFVGADGYRTTLSSVKIGSNVGSIRIGSDVLVMNGVRISSAAGITIGDGCMLANFCYLTDSDWHDIYDRTNYPGRSMPIVLERGVWIGDSAIVLKGVKIGENSIIGAGSVVTKNIPANVVAAGNPAKVVKKLDPGRIRVHGDWKKGSGS
jgi:acetyltransferase-like isoleucine patch superfamily enzyme